jgi:hypothetical protein
VKRRKRLEPTPDGVRAWRDRTRAKALERQRTTRRAPLRARSRKRTEEAPDRAWALQVVSLRDGVGCWAARLDIGPCGGTDPARALYEGHEVIPRSAWPGGHLVPSNIRLLCQRHHDWVGDHPTLAHAVGLHGYSWERPDG